jgi:hypothetical protein
VAALAVVEIDDIVLRLHDDLAADQELVAAAGDRVAQTVAAEHVATLATVAASQVAAIALPSELVQLVEIIETRAQGEADELISVMSAPQRSMDDIPEAFGLPATLSAIDGFREILARRDPCDTIVEVMPSPTPLPVAEVALASIIDGRYPRSDRAGVRRSIQRAFARNTAVAEVASRLGDYSYRDAVLSAGTLDGCFTLPDIATYRKGQAALCTDAFELLYRSYYLSGDHRFIDAASRLLGAMRAYMPAPLFKRFTSGLRSLSERLGQGPM